MPGNLDLLPIPRRDESLLPYLDTNFQRIKDMIEAQLDASDISDGSVTTAKMADNSVTNAKMADNSVGSAEIIDGSILPVDLSAAASRGSWGQLESHGTFIDFNDPNLDFGGRFIQGSANGPGESNQYYHMVHSLGSQYPFSRFGQQWAMHREASGGAPYLFLRDKEESVWGAWRKVRAGFADNAGLLDGIDSTGFAISSHTHDAATLARLLRRKTIRVQAPSWSTTSSTTVDWGGDGVLTYNFSKLYGAETHLIINMGYTFYTSGAGKVLLSVQVGAGNKNSSTTYVNEGLSHKFRSVVVDTGTGLPAGNYLVSARIAAPDANITITTDPGDYGYLDIHEVPV